MKNTMFFLFFGAVFSLYAEEISNSWCRVVVTPEQGIHAQKFIWPDGTDSGHFGFARVYNTKAVDTLKKLTGRVEKTKDSEIGFHICGKEDILSDLEITGSYKLAAEYPELTIKYAFENIGKKVQLFGFTIQNFAGTQTVSNTWYFPHARGVLVVKDPFDSGEQWIYQPASNWCGLISAQGKGLALIVNPYPLAFYMWLSKKTIPSLEWRYKKQYLQPGQFFTAEYTVIPFTGLKRISGAGDSVVGELRQNEALLFSSRPQTLYYEFIDPNGVVLQRGKAVFAKAGTVISIVLKGQGNALRILNSTRLLAILTSEYVPPKEPSVPEYVSMDLWYGYPRWKFKVNGCDAWIACPFRAAPGKPWSWSMEYPNDFTERCAALELLEAGYHHGHIQVGNTFGSPDAQKSFRMFYDLCQKLGLAQKTVLIGLSRGGFYSYRFASENPEKVAVIYADAPVCDFKSWPGGFGKGARSAKDWERLKNCYGFQSDVEAKAYPGNPIDTLERLAKEKVALIHVIGMADNVVPPAENTDIVESRYRKLGGTIKVIRRPDVGHHPHGLDDSSEVVRFILEHNGR